MDKIELQISALSNSESAPGHFVLVLEDSVSKKRLPIIIGSFEAQAIAIYMEKLLPPRPLTHDLFVKTLQQAGIAMLEVLIYGIVNGGYAAYMVLKSTDGGVWQVDARSSDALALAVRFGAPVFMDKQLFEQHSLKDEVRQGILRGSLREYSMEELDMMLSELLEKEEYESAAKVRDVIEQKRNRQLP
ncbi:MAG: bifunctional nuclease family protein [Bacteroidetes bacterium]|nr:MAG: bifunctional nuclease family protein [Bacteroidota bacterium]